MAEGTPIGALAVRIGADASELVSELKKADTALGKTGALLAEGAASAAKFAAVAGVAGAALAAMVHRVADSADQLGKMAQKVGISVEALSGLKYAAELSDLSLEQLGTGLKQLSKFMVENKMEGVSVEEQLLKIADEFSGAADGATKTAVAMKYFGKSGADMIPLLNQGRAGIEQLRQEAQRLGIVISQEAAAAAEQFNDNLKRLKASSEGTAIVIAGPLVKALGDAAGKFLEAKREGEGFFEAMRRGLAELLTGNDLHKWNKQFVGAVDEQLQAENALDAAKRRLRESDTIWTRDALRNAEQRLTAAKAEVERLQKIKPILAPDEAAPGKPKGQLTQDGIDEAALAEVIAEGKAAMAREQQIRDVLHQVREEDDKRELDQVKFKNEERARIEKEGADARLALIDYENAEAIRRGEELLAIEEAQESERQRLGYKYRQLNLDSAKTFAGSMAVLMQTNNKKMFEIGKQAAIAEAVINTYTMAVGAYRAMASIPYVGPALGIAAAGAALAFGMAQVQAIRSQTFGGGAAAAPVAASNPATGAPVGTPGDVGGGARGGQTTVVQFHGSSDERGLIRRFVDTLNENSRDGGRIVVAGRA
jgi:hypothetical protein